MLQLLLRRALPLLLLLSGGLGAHASGMVQLVVHGQVDVDGGVPVELELAADGKRVSFRGVLAQGTRSGDLTALLERRLTRAGIRFALGPDAPARGPVSLFVEDVESIALRLGGGLRATLTSSEEAPARLRLLPPRRADVSQGGDVRIFVTCEQRSTGTLSQARLDLALPDTRTSSAWVADNLSRKAIGGAMRSSRPTLDSWATTGTTAGADAVGMSVELYADGDWGVELTLAPRIEAR